MTTDHAEITPDGDRATVTLRRRFDTSAEDLWAALTEPERLARWFGAAATVRPGAGGRVELRWEQPEQWVRGDILTWRPPELLEYEWHFPGESESVVRFELTPDGDGCLLTLTHRRLGPAGSGYAPAWHAYLDRLLALYRGEDLAWEQRFAELMPEYR